MPKYHYLAKNLAGKQIRSQIEAADEAEAKLKVRHLKLVPIKIVPVAAKAAGSQKQDFLSVLFSKKVKAKDLQIFTRQFSVLINSGITVIESLTILSGGVGAPSMKETVGKVKTLIEGGKTLGESMAAFPLTFDRFYCNMVKAGEASGALEAILARMAQYLEKNEKLKNQIKGALFYPVAIIIVAIIVIAGIMIFIIPKFQELFSSAQQEPPALTMFVVSLSDKFVNNWWLIVLGIVGLPIFLITYYGTPNGRRNMDLILIGSPLFGELVLKSSIARFSRTMSTLLDSGIPLIDAIEISANTSGNYLIESTLKKCKEAVVAGKPFHLPLSREKVIPEIVPQMVAIGEQTGAVASMFGKIADFYEDEVDNAVKGLTSLLEPILMVVLGGIIAFLVIAMYLPVFNMANVVGAGGG